jgi:dipeptidyl aminopeptidase/acylaminoacyl peptidase
MLQWSPDGRRFAIAAGTNEVAVATPGGALALFAPDEGRDHPVEFCWVDDQTLFAASWSDRDESKGGGALISLAEEHARWLSRSAAPVVLKQPVRARDVRAVVGHDFREVFAIDTNAERLVSRASLPSTFHNGRSVAGWSPHGSLGVFAPPPIEQKYVRGTGRNAGGRTELVLFRPADPRALAQLEVPGEVASLHFAPDERRFLVVSRTIWGGIAHCTLFEGASKRAAFDAPLVERSYRFPDAGSLVWSPDGEHLALLRTDSTIEITTPSGQRRASFVAQGTREEDGLMFVGKDRIALIGQRGIRVFDTGGKLVMRFDVDPG